MNNNNILVVAEPDPLSSFSAPPLLFRVMNVLNLIVHPGNNRVKVEIDELLEPLLSITLRLLFGMPSRSSFYIYTINKRRLMISRYSTTPLSFKFYFRGYVMNLGFRHGIHN